MATNPTESRQQVEIFQAMRQPDFYPHAVSTLEERDTHISKVFLTGPFAYKIKKPVNLNFLDFSTLEQRQRFCRREVDLNRRMTTGVYLGVVPITRQAGHYYLAGSGPVVEYAVKMRQLPEADCMRQLLHSKKLTRENLNALVVKLVAFYRQAATAKPISAVGSWQTVRTNTEENFQQVQEFVGDIVDERMYQIIRAATRAFLQRRKILFEQRIENQKIRDCHGDLRTGHIYFADGIQVIDCIEFNDRFRYGDISSDLAFLAMDLDFEGFAESARHLIHAYLEDTHDEGMLLLLDFYKCYRACVRVKVNCFRLRNERSGTYRHSKLLTETRRYLDLAYRYAVQFTRPTVWVVCGLPASGKSTVASALAKILALGIYRSDIVRKMLFGQPSSKSQVVPFEQGIYSKEATALTYGKLLMLAQQEVERGRSVIIDAGFSKQHYRDEAIRMARDVDANILFVECAAPFELLKKRLTDRENQATVSDARLQHLKKIAAGFDPMDDLREEVYIRIDTSLALETEIRQVIAHDYGVLARQNS